VTAFAGMFRRDRAGVGGSALQAMLARAAGKSLAAPSLWRDGPVALGRDHDINDTDKGNARLATLRDCTIAGDVRIDNRDELLAQLGTPPSKTLNDSELVLRAHERWGEGCAERLLGDFAFVIWDRSKQELYCARDHLGIRPFFYFLSPQIFAFASRIKGLLSFEEVPRNVNEVELGLRLVGVFDDQAATLFAGLHRLEPGHWLMVGQTSERRRRYWALSQHDGPRLGSEQEYADAFRELLTAAVSCRLDGRGAVGSFLSGGLDSTSITCIARDIRDGTQPLDCFSVVYEGNQDADERRYIDAVVAQGGIRLHRLDPSDHSPLGPWLDSLLVPDDEPPLYEDIHTWLVAREAKASGVPVLLSGEGGDNVVSHGVGYLTELVRHGRWFKFAREGSAVAAQFDVPARTWIRRWGIEPIAPQPIRSAWRALRRARGLDWPGEAPIREEFARRTGLRERIALLQRDRDAPIRSAREGHLREMTSGTHSYILGVATQAASVFGVETRFPFYDRRVVEFCQLIPPDLRLRGGLTRVLPRIALVGILPEEVRLRPGKALFLGNFAAGFKGRDRPDVERLLADSGQISEYVDTRKLLKVYGEFPSPRTRKFSALLYRTAMLGRWLEAVRA
jgi:asparagine synthase (glutamine-hydrolysing)